MSFSFPLFLTGIVLVLIQGVAAIPWVLAFNWDTLRTLRERSLRGSSTGEARFWSTITQVVLFFVAAVLIGAAVLAAGIVQDRESLESLGRLYACILHLQLLADALIIIFVVTLFVWPKGGAVALAAFREGVRQPLFWLLTGAAVLLLSVSPFIPYFTFGEDFIVVQELGYDTIMLASVVLGVLASSMSISEEIEGRTAITLMSKPVSRRQFLLGKFLGIFLVTLLLTGLLGWFFEWILLAKHWFDRMDPIPTPEVLSSVEQYLALPTQPNAILHGAGFWVYETYYTLGGLMLGSCQVMVLLAISVALATRLPMVANLVICWVVYTLGHLTPVLAQIAARRDTGSAAGRLLAFTSQVFDIALPGLEFFSLGPALAQDSPTLPFTYVGSVCIYGAVYAVIALLFGLVLFEDRDLA